jgi:hypothetical protein
VPELPPILDRFVAELKEEGFSIAVDQTGQAHFGNRLLELARGDNRIRLVRDRGQWDIEVAVGASWRTLTWSSSPFLAVRSPRAQQRRTRPLRRCVMTRLPSTPDGLTELNRKIEALNQEAWNDQFGGATKPAE